MQDDVLIKLKSGKERNALFLIHPLHGHVLCYAPLAFHLGAHRDIYGIQSRGLIQPDRRAGSVEEMAADYAAEITRAQPKGPYLLAGWSLGAAIAAEIAQILQNKGEEISAVLSIDHMLLNLKEFAAQNSIQTNLDQSLLIMTFQGDFNEDIHTEYVQCPEEEKANFIVDNMYKYKKFPAALDPKQAKSMIETTLSNFKAGVEYTPRVEGVPIVYFVANQHLPFSGASHLRNLLTQSLEGKITYDVEGCNHFNILSMPHVVKLAARMKEYFSVSQR